MFLLNSGGFQFPRHAFQGRGLKLSYDITMTLAYTFQGHPQINFVHGPLPIFPEHSTEWSQLIYTIFIGR